MFKVSFEDVSKTFQGCFKRVSRMIRKRIKWYFEGAFRGLKGALKLFPRSVSRNF